MRDIDGKTIKTDNCMAMRNNNTHTTALNYYVIHNKSQVMYMAADYVIIIRYKAISIEYYDSVSSLP